MQCIFSRTQQQQQKDTTHDHCQDRRLEASTCGAQPLSCTGGFIKCFASGSLVGKWLMPHADDKARHEFKQWLKDPDLAERGQCILDLIDAAVATEEDRTSQAYPERFYGLGILWYE